MPWKTVSAAERPRLYENDGAPEVRRLPINISDSICCYMWKSSAELTRGLVYLQHGYGGDSRISWLHRGVPRSFRDEVSVLRQKRKESIIKEGGNKEEDPVWSEIMKSVEASASELFLNSKSCLHDTVAIPEYHNSIIESLNSEGFDVVACDLPGHGMSTGERGFFSSTLEKYYSVVTTMIDERLTVIRRKESGAKVLMIGASFGAAIIFNYLQFIADGDADGAKNKQAIQISDIKGAAFLGGMFRIREEEGILSWAGPVVRALSHLYPSCVLSRADMVCQYPWVDIFNDDLQCPYRLDGSPIPMRAGTLAVMLKVMNKARTGSLRYIASRLLFIHNSTDSTCPVVASIDVANRCKAAGIDVTLVVANIVRGWEANVFSRDEVNITEGNALTEGIEVDHTFLSDPDGPYVQQSLLLPWILNEQ